MKYLCCSVQNHANRINFDHFFTKILIRFERDQRAAQNTLLLHARHREQLDGDAERTVEEKILKKIFQ